MTRRERMQQLEEEIKKIEANRKNEPLADELIKDKRAEIARLSNSTEIEFEG